MPGDDLVGGAWDVSTHAVTIQATPADIWPWPKQMGYQRGGMYSYDWIDQRMGILDQPSAREVLALLGSTLGLQAVVLLGTPGGPSFSDTVSFFDVLGFIGLYIGAVLILRAVLATVRDARG